jgi:drug/metabolite transporter (DMT)-like permease
MGVRLWLVWTCTCLLWSSTFLFIKIGLADIPPFTFAAARLAIAALVLTSIASARGEWRRLPRPEARHVLASGLILLGANYGLVYWGTQYVASGVVAVLQSSQPTVAVIVGALLGVERVTRRRVAAVLAGVAGTALIFAGELRLGGSQGVAGLAAVGVAALCVAVSYSWLKRHVRQASGTTVAALQCVSGVLPLAAAAIVVEGTPDWRSWTPASWIALSYLSIAASVVAFCLNYWLLRRMTTSAMLMMGVLEVPVALLLGWMVLGETLRGGMLAGAVLITAGVVLTVTSEREAATTRHSEPPAT